MEMETSTPGHHEGSREANAMAPDSDLGDDSPMSHNGDDDLSDGLDEGGGGGQSPPSGGGSPRHHHHPHAAALLAAAAAATAAGGGTGDHTDVLAKLKMQVRDIKVWNDYDRPLPFQLGGVGGLGGTPHHPSQPRPTNGAPPTSTAANGGGLQHVPQDSFQLPVPFPFPHPAAAFLPPVSTTHQPPQTTAPSSGSSHSSEGSNASSQHTWSFEEQFKQLYEINDDPKRKEFLDDLFSFMQKRGTPINRLPIMAKSVLDLYELYNLVIARGGLVDVINKKLWQEIIKGLHLPSSITSAAFTLRTQYMKYLYPYECEKRRLSTPAELQAAIDGNRREGRRSSYGQYDQMQRSPNPAAGLQMSPLSLVQQQHTQQQLAARMLSLHHQQQQQQQHNGAHHPSHPPPMGQPTANGVQGGPLPGLAPSEFEARMMEYVKLLNKEMRTTAADFAGGGCGTPPPVIRAGGDISPPTIPSSTSPLHPLEMSRMTLWNLYSNNNHPVQPTANANAVEPQKEPINLSETSNTIKREPECRESPPAAKRVSKEEEMDDREDEDDEDEEQEQERLQEQQQKSQQLSPSAHIKINSRGDLRNGDNSLVVSMELNGVTYQGVLFAQNPPSRTAMAS